MNIEKIRSTPIKIDSWAYGKVGKRNNGSFKGDYQNLEAKECEECLIDISNFELSGEDYYFSRFAHNEKFLAKGLISEKIFLRKSHAERLSKADKHFRERGLFLHIVSGWRHPELQRIIKKEYAQKFGREKADQLFASIGGKVPAPHSTGAAFDVELRNLATKKKIGMDVFFEGEKISSLYWAEELMREGKIDAVDMESVKNRRILYHGLCTRGVIFEKKEDLFIGHPGEYWHYGDGDVLSAYLRKEPFFKYGIAYP